MLQGLSDRIDFVVAFSATDDSTAALAEFIPPCCVYTQFREDVCEAILARQAKMWKRGRGCVSRAAPPRRLVSPAPARYKCAIICDDIFYDKKVFQTRCAGHRDATGRAAIRRRPPPPPSASSAR